MGAGSRGEGGAAAVEGYGSGHNPAAHGRGRWVGGGRMQASACLAAGGREVHGVIRPDALLSTCISLPLGVSSLWMALGWNYYTGYAARAEPTMSEDITVTQKDD